LKVRFFVNFLFSASMNVRTHGVQAIWKIREIREMASFKFPKIILAKPS